MSMNLPIHINFGNITTYFAPVCPEDPDMPVEIIDSLTDFKITSCLKCGITDTVSALK